MIDEFIEKHIEAKLPSSIFSNNFLVDQKLHLSGDQYIEFGIMNDRVFEYLHYFLNNVGELTANIDLSHYYGDQIDLKYLIENVKYDQNSILFNRFDACFDSERNLKVLEINVNKPTTFSEQVYDQIKNEHEYLTKSLNNYFEEVDQPQTIALVMDEARHDNVSTFHILKELIVNPNITFELAEARNLIVDQDGVYVFDKHTKVNRIIYYRPFEEDYNTEIFQQLLTHHINGTVLIQSSPLTMLLQTKGFFALTTYLRENQMLDVKYNQIIDEHFPQTVIVTKNNLQQLLERKDKYIFKPINGRLSNGVFAGIAFEKAEISEFFNDEIDQVYIAQELINIHEQQLPKITFDQPTYEQAYVVYGVFSIASRYIQTVSRVSKRLITNDGSWTLPIVPIAKIRQQVVEYDSNLMLTTADKIELMFEHHFNGFGLATTEYLTKQALVIDDSVREQLDYVAKTYMKILAKTQKYIIDNKEMYQQLYQFDLEFIKSSSALMSILSRVDIIITDDNQLKVLEANVETPAGLKEAYEVCPALTSGHFNNMRVTDDKQQIIETIVNRLREIEIDFGQVLAIISLDYYEDLYNADALKPMIEAALERLAIDVPVEVVRISDLKIIDGRLMTSENKQITVMYRYFPLDWFTQVSLNKDVLLTINEQFKTGQLVSLTPNESIISQHKSINAIIYTLLGSKRLFNQEERTFIKKHIPFTDINRTRFFKNCNRSKPFLTKSTLGREGNGIYINQQYEREVVFQEMENVELISLKQVAPNGKSIEISGFPVYGIYVTDLEPCGIYTRVSGQITNANAYYLPVFKQSDKLIKE